MKKFIYILIAIVSISFLACENDKIITENLNTDDVVLNDLSTKNKYIIPLDAALEELNSTLTFIDKYSSVKKANKKKREIKSVKIVHSKSNSNTTTFGRQKVAPSYSDTLLYVVDFEDNAGSAILAADSRIPEKVLVVTDEGNIIDSIPVYENGMFESTDYFSDFSLYNEDEDDYYIGQVDAQVIEYCIDYADDYVGGTNSSSNTITSTVYGSWANNEKIYPKLTTAWHQTSPFNDAIPTSRYFFWQSWKRGPAGCVPIAIAQIMAYHEFPSNLSCNDYIINWTGIKNICTRSNPNATGTNYDRQAVARLVSNIGAWCSTIYTPDFAFALPRKARDCMSTFGYSNVIRTYGYNESKVEDMLRNDNPVFIAAISGLTNGHAWVIDGYLDRSRDIKNYNSSGVLVSSTTENQKLMHCNFGWNGYCNGYYTSGIFNLNDGAVYKESYDSYASTSSNFKWAFHIITYNNPN